MNCFMINFLSFFIAVHTRQKNPITIQCRNPILDFVFSLLKVKEKLKVNVFQTFGWLASPGWVAANAIDPGSQSFYLDVEAFFFGKLKRFGVGFFGHFKMLFLKKFVAQLFVLLNHLPCLVAVPLILNGRNKKCKDHHRGSTKAYQ